MDDPDIPEPADASDLALFAAARDGSDAARDELQRRYLHALRTVAAGYRGGDPDRDGLIDRILSDLASAPEPTSEGAVPITLFTLVREEKLDTTERRGPIGLVDLAGPSPLDAAGTAAAGETARRRVLLDAFADLDQRDQVLLWFTAIEGALPRSLSSRLSIGGADAASVKAFRARSNLRRAYAQRRAATAGRGPACDTLADDLVRWADGDLAPNFDDGPRGAHLAACSHCRQVLAELHQITGGLLVEAAAIRRAMVGPAATAAVPATTAVAAFGAPLPALHDDGPPDALADLDTAGDPDSGDRRSRAAGVLLVAVALAIVLGSVAFWRARAHAHDAQVQTGNQQEAPPTRAVTTSTRSSVSIATVHTASSTTSTSSTTTTTRRRGSTGTTGNGGSGGNGGTWTDPGTSGTTTPAVTPPTTSAGTTAPPATTTPPTTSATTVTTTPTTVTATTDAP